MNQFLRVLRIIIAGIFAFVSAGTNLFAAEGPTWPKVIKAAKGDITIYQPTPEAIDGTTLTGRAAVSVKLKDAKRPVFGAIWMTSTLVVDRDTRIAVIRDIKIPNIRFSDEIDTALNAKIVALIEQEAPSWNLEASIDDLIATVESSSVKSDSKYKNDPPEIIVANKPTVLVLIDGKPILKELKGYELQRIENSPFFIVFDPKEKSYFMYGDRVWFTASDINSNWELVKKPSSSLKKLAEDIDKANSAGQTAETADKKEPEAVPAIIVRTSPAELIVITGEPEFTPIQSTNLLYVTNTDNEVFMDIKSNKYFILLSGRWYTSASMSGPWAFVEADKLPGDFAKIPEGSEKDLVLASVAGTEASKEAILDSQIPQTAEVDRKTATVAVEFDGEPKFEPVDGTSMLYAVNSPQTVLKVSNTYYCVDNGIWFEATVAKGPYKVTDKRPEEVEKIEPSSSVYNVKYVYIYESTPEVVYVGYTPGYYGSYVYGPTVIYGTGYPYVPWYGSYYYPRPVTYGFSMHYNPYTGWGMSVGVSYGPIHMSFGGGYHGGYYGPPMYRPPYHYPPGGGGYYGRPGYGSGGYPPDQGGRPDGGERPGTGRPDRPSTGTGGGNQVSNNMYTKDRAGVKPSTSDRPAAGASAGNRTASAKQQPNNVYADKNGNVYQQNNKGGWDQRQNNSWQSADKAATGSGANKSSKASASTRPSAGSSTSAAARPSPSTSYNRSELDKQSASRDRGTTRTSNYNSYSGASGSAGAASRGGFSGGGARGGGGRR